MTAVKYASTELPTIGIRDLVGDDLARRQAIADAIGHATCEVGFLYITSHNVDPALTVGVREAAKQISTLPMEEKMSYHIGHPKSHKGYVPEGEEIYDFGKPDYEEAFSIGPQVANDHLLVLADTPLIGTNEWPGLPDFRAQVLAYYDAVFTLGHRLFDIFAFALDLPEGCFEPIVTYPSAKLRLVHYPFGASIEGVPGTGAHTDCECFTLPFVGQSGSKVLNEEGVWVDTPPVKNAAGGGVFVVSISDMPEVLSAGTFVATARRVCKVPQGRYSFSLFFVCGYHMLTRPLPTFLTAGEAGEYQELSIGGHMWSQALQTYRYLHEKVSRGELQLPGRVHGTNTFDHLKR